MVNKRTKFDVAISTHYENRKGDTKKIENRVVFARATLASAGILDVVVCLSSRCFTETAKRTIT